MPIIEADKALGSSIPSYFFFLVKDSIQITWRGNLLELMVPQQKMGSLIQVYLGYIIGPRREKTCLWGFSNNTGADQPARPCSLISAFVIRFFRKCHI